MIIDMQEHRPHISLELIDGHVDVAPVLMYENIIKGTLKITDLDDYEVLMRSIIKDWLSKL